MIDDTDLTPPSRSVLTRSDLLDLLAVVFGLQSHSLEPDVPDENHHCADSVKDSEAELLYGQPTTAADLNQKSKR